jgi:hypothetical protein
MSKTHQGRKQYKSMRGKVVDMDLLRKRNELTPAVGNAKVNARGDELGPGGKIIKKREERVRDYYNTPGAAADETGRFTTPVKEEAVVAAEELLPEEAELFADDEEWVEDADGNFVKASTTKKKK